MKNHFYQVPDEIMCRKDISATDKLLYGVIKRLKVCFASNKRLAEITGSSEITIKRSLKRLKEAGLIRQLPNQGKRTCYELSGRNDPINGGKKIPLSYQNDPLNGGKMIPDNRGLVRGDNKSSSKSGFAATTTTLNSDHQEEQGVHFLLGDQYLYADSATGVRELRRKVAKFHHDRGLSPKAQHQVVEQLLLRFSATPQSVAMLNRYLDFALSEEGEKIIDDLTFTPDDKIAGKRGDRIDFLLADRIDEINDRRKTLLVAV